MNPSETNLHPTDDHNDLNEKTLNKNYTPSKSNLNIIIIAIEAIIIVGLLIALIVVAVKKKMMMMMKKLIITITQTQITMMIQIMNM